MLERLPQKNKEREKGPDLKIVMVVTGKTCNKEPDTPFPCHQSRSRT